MKLFLPARNTRARFVLVVAMAAAIGLAGLAAWALTGKEILTKCAANYDDIRDYVCKITVTTDFPDVRMPKRTFTVYFKKPGKVKIDSGGQIVVVPKDVIMLGNLERHLRDDSKALLAGQTTSKGRTVYFLKILPKEKESEDKLLLWVWGDNWTLKRSEIWHEGAKAITADWTYVRVGGFWVPHKVVCRVREGRLARHGAGTLTIEFSGWKLNQGLSDDLFRQKPS